LRKFTRLGVTSGLDL